MMVCRNARLGTVDVLILLIEEMGRNIYSDWEYNLRTKASVAKAFDLSTNHHVACLVARLLEEPEPAEEVSGPHIAISEEARKVINTPPSIFPNFSSVRLPNFLPLVIHENLSKS